MRVESVVKLFQRPFFGMDAPVLVRFPLWLRSCVACVLKPGQNNTFFYFGVNSVAVWDEGFPSSCFVPLCCVQSLEGQKEDLASFAGI